MQIFKKKNNEVTRNSEKFLILKGAYKGVVKVPGDKSISQRALILGLISVGTSTIKNILDSEDVYHTLKAVKALGAKIKIIENNITIKGVGLGNLISPKKPIYMGNSGTGARLLIGLVAGSNATVTFYGDESLSKRPMNRIIRPLEKMGCKFVCDNEDKLPITVIGARSKGFTMPIKHKTTVPSAQVKSAILLAALTARGVTTVIEPIKSRDYTEKMLLARGIKLNSKQNSFKKNVIRVSGSSYLKSIDENIPGDPSSAAFIAVLCLITKGSKVTIENVLNDKIRLKIFEVLKKMGGKIDYINKNKDTCDIKIQYSKLCNITLKETDAMPLIDEFPILSVAASCGTGLMKMKGLGELRYKESDRFHAIKSGLQICGINIKAIKDDLEILGSDKIKGGCTINANYDHRIAMAFNILGLVSEKPIKVLGNKSISSSFPNFFELINLLSQKND